MLKIFIFILFYWPCFSDTKFPDDHAPIAVMADHKHKKEEYMLSFRYGQMNMTENFKGTKKVSSQDIFKEGFNMAPKNMSMSMSMFGFMYGFTDNFTFSIMGPFIQKNMSMTMNQSVKTETTDPTNSNEHGSNHILHHHNPSKITESQHGASHITNKSESQSHKMSTQGFGDVKVGGIFTLYKSKKTRPNQILLLYAGISLPTGSIEEKIKPNGQRQPYSMQLGSGTVDPLVSSTYVIKKENWSLGSQIQGLFRVYDNTLNYRLGNEYKTNIWLAYNLLKALSVSLRLEYKNWGRIQGADSSLDKKRTPTNRPDFYLGESLNSSLGLNFYRTKGAFKNHRLALEVGFPIYQKLKLSMGLKHYFMLGWQLSL